MVMDVETLRTQLRELNDLFAAIKHGEERRACVAQNQVRGGLPEGVRVRQPRPAFHRRIHRSVQPETTPSSLADQTPDEAYFATLPAIKSAA